MQHLIKLSVGTDSVEGLRAWQAGRRTDWAGRPVPYHVTRRAPRRAATVLDGGSIYWVIRGAIQARQRILGLDETHDQDGVPHCVILLDPELVATEAWPHRPFQGWRYLDAEKAPPDLGAGGWVDALPSQLARDLRAIGVF